MVGKSKITNLVIICLGDGNPENKNLNKMNFIELKRAQELL